MSPSLILRFLFSRTSAFHQLFIHKHFFLHSVYSLCRAGCALENAAPAPKSDGSVPCSPLSRGKVASALAQALEEPGWMELPEDKFMP